jgi:hypothetical protein
MKKVVYVPLMALLMLLFASAVGFAQKRSPTNKYKGMGNRHFSIKRKTPHGKSTYYIATWGTMKTCATYGKGVYLKPMSYRRYYYHRQRRK